MNSDDIKNSLNILADKDAKLREAIALVGYPDARGREEGFFAFLRIIIAQQISVQAANAIEAKLFNKYPDFSPDICVSKSLEDLRACGLSMRKTEYIQNLSHNILNGTLPINEFADMPDDEVIKHITALKGFGVWSAEIYCLFSLGRHDIFPADDMALQESLRLLLGRKTRPSGKITRKLTNKWRPHRSAMAIFLWHYYKGRPV